MTQEHPEGAPAPVKAKGKKKEILEALSLTGDGVEAAQPGADEGRRMRTLQDLRKLLPAEPEMPMTITVDGEDHKVFPGEWHGEFEHPDHPLPINCPVTPLGKLPKGAGFAFLDPLGDLYVLKPSAGKGDISALFAPFTAYLLWAWPRKHVKKSKDEEETVIDNYHAEQAREALFDAAGVYGTFDPQGIIRGRGCWRDDDGKLVFHAGDAVLVDGKWKKPGRIGGYIYPSKGAIGRPRDGGAKSFEAAQKVLEVLRTFNWERPKIDAELYLGWMASARLGAALEERPSTWVQAQEGSGKSLLFQVTKAFMQQAIVTAADASAAMIYMTLKEDCLAVILDEQEAELDNKHVYNIVKLARISYSGDVLGRGSSEGVPVGYRLESSFYFGSVVKPSIKTQDESRMIDLSLSPQREGQNNEEPDLGDVREWGAIIMARLIKKFDQLEPTVRAVKAFLRKNGYDKRGADTLGVVIACHHLVVYDVPIDDDVLKEWVDQLPAPKKTVTWQRMVAFMFETRPEEFRDPKSKDKSLEAVLMSLKAEMVTGDATLVKEAVDAANVKVRPFGMFFDFDPTTPGSLKFEDLELFVPNGHAGMVSLMAGSDWAGRVGTTGPWAGVLKQAAQQGVGRDSGKPVKKNNAISVRGHFLHLARAMSSFE